VLKQELDSSVVKAAEYDPESHTLEIEIKHGRLYRYEDVPEDVYTELLKAPSKGSFFNKEIRDQYKSTRIQ
jgi:lysyl-tRNA synthetase class 2